MRSLRQWLGLCAHKWEIIDGYNIMRSTYKRNDPTTPLRTVQIGSEYTLKCSVCGDIKRRKGA